MNKRFLVVAAIAIAVAQVGLAGVASAKPLEKVHFHDVTSEVVPDFCGDTDVRIDSDVRGAFTFNQRGPNGLVYGHERLHGVDVYTNLDTGKTFTLDFNANGKDQSITDNGDGTSTIDIKTSGPEKVYGPDGERVFLSSGMFIVRILVDNGGTPTDPFDDQFLEFLGDIKQAGRDDTANRDFCEDFLHFTG
jgi:hypothetical protein